MFFDNVSRYKIHYVVIGIIVVIVLYLVFLNQYIELRSDGIRPSLDGNGELEIVIDTLIGIW